MSWMFTYGASIPNIGLFWPYFWLRVFLTVANNKTNAFLARGRLGDE